MNQRIYGSSGSRSEIEYEKTRQAGIRRPRVENDENIFNNKSSRINNLMYGKNFHGCDKVDNVLNDSKFSTKSNDRGSKSTLRFYSSACCLPDPNKKTEGEDAYMITPCGTVFAVADGVGGWSEVGIDSGEYSRELCRNAAKIVLNRGETNPRAIMRYAFDHSTAIGTSTCCVISIEKNVLKAANLGDSGFMVLRPTASGFSFIMQTEEQQHSFNVPHQIGTNSLDMPHDAHQYELQMHPGDIVIAGTDGLFDNLSCEDIKSELEKHMSLLSIKDSINLSNDQKILKKIASHIATTAYLVSKDHRVTTPFGINAAKHGFRHEGGKNDDITVVVSVVANCDTIDLDNPAGKESTYFSPDTFTMEGDDDDDKSASVFNSPDTIYTSSSLFSGSDSPGSVMMSDEDDNCDQ